MSLQKCIKSIEKGYCPVDCELRSRWDWPIVLIPPPPEPKMMIVSRDPTRQWAHFYEYLLSVDTSSEEKRKMLFNAIPLQLALRVITFMRGKIDEQKSRCLFDAIFNNGYWTHLHKCPTDEAVSFQYKNAKKCADRWLREEVESAIANGVSFAVALGNDVGTWMAKYAGRIEIAMLPHPSPQNNQIWYRKVEDEKIKQVEEATERLLELIKQMFIKRT
jgi:hypothetical protein